VCRNTACGGAREDGHHAGPRQGVLALLQISLSLSLGSYGWGGGGGLEMNQHDLELAAVTNFAAGCADLSPSTPVWLR
jgi:hypothetical protein